MKKEKRIAVIDHDRCKPKKCNFECKNICPVNRTGKNCIEVDRKSIAAKISEELCIATTGTSSCNQCVKVCPFGAVQIVCLPTQIESDLVYSYGENGFRLYKLPIPKLGNILGFIGQNGIGKSTLMNILSNKIKPNFGVDSAQTHTGLGVCDSKTVKSLHCEAKNEADDIKKILQSTRGTELQTYFKSLYDGKLKICTKPQNIDKYSVLFKKKKDKHETVSDLLIQKGFQSTNDWHNRVLDGLELHELFKNHLSTLSGGELQRLICAIALMQEANVYIFDEPTNYLDVRQRLNVAKLIKELSNDKNYIFIVEHDLSILDYTSDFVCILYGTPGAFGAISTPHATGNAINMFFSGYIKSDNMRFRKEKFDFKESLTIEYEEVGPSKLSRYSYEQKEINFDNFTLQITPGEFADSTITVLLGKNGTGKTTFLNYLSKACGLVVSYKTQYTDLTKFATRRDDGKLIYPTVIELFSKCNMNLSGMFLSDVIVPLDIKRLYDRKLHKLSGGELQRVMITYCLGKKAHLYLLDEPSASLDIEQRAIVTKVIKRFMLHNKKCGFVVEHDIMMSMSLAMEYNSKIVVFDTTHIDFEDAAERGTGLCEVKKRISVSSAPLTFVEGMNMFLKQLDITFRTDKETKRPRINKHNSNLDGEQKRLNKFYL